MSELPKDVWDEILSVANKDGKITSEEENLLKKIKSNLDYAYNKIQNEGADRDAITMQVIESAYSHAESDNVTSWDELAIIKKLKEIVKKI